ncbi:MAG: valine--tRNA ligase [Candidatus Magnetoovum sp. WYHC-5]|nr:valine--tRNA ligase [Candidatus Magnetoovum sp. WYHC-5]
MPVKELPKGYNPAEVEDKWYELWLQAGIFTPEFSPDEDSQKPTYSIVIPPPNVTGSLHMGHALNATIQDILSRWKRMGGFRVLWLPGTDHAGIATQNVVERQLAGEGLDRYKLGRKEFIERVWLWKEEYGGRIIHQLKKLGASCDWTRERFTMDEGLSKAVGEVFVSLFDRGLIYRALRLINWCPRCYTALSDLEVEHEEVHGKLTYIRYPLEDKSSYIVVATTRPETMLGDTAVCVHPQDGRYINIVGKNAILPLVNRLIPVITDKTVDPSFGTGSVKVTPSHDFNDEAIAKRQDPPLPFITVIGDDGKMTQEAGRSFAGLDRYECRKKVVEALKERGLIEKIVDHKHSVGHCYRCKTVIEPLATTQWYVNVAEMAANALNVVKDGRIRIIPDGWKNSYYSWMENIRDWCISRQIWWGHRIPVWYCPDCVMENGVLQGEYIYHIFFAKTRGYYEGTYAALKEAGFTHDEILSKSKTIKVGINVVPFILNNSNNVNGVCPKCGSSHIMQDPDVLDTWFSSSLWPFSTLGWPENTKDLKDFYPTGTLVTAFDILFFWVARMIMMGMEFMKEIPFKDVYIHAIVRDAKGDKMSKSKGNVVDPLILIDKYGTDAFRFTLAAFAAQGRDIRFAEDRVEGYRHFVNKLWNATRFIHMNIADFAELDLKTIEEINTEVETIEKTHLNITDRWILDRLAETAEVANNALEDYRFNDAASVIYQFIWHEFCDWYIELSKTSLSCNKKELALWTKRCLLYVLDNTLRLLHPFMPFVTEELWNTLPHKNKFIMETNYPKVLGRDHYAQRKMNYLIDVISGVRNIRGELNISPTKKLCSLIKTLTRECENCLTENKDYIINIAKLEKLDIAADVDKPKGAAVSIKPELEVFVPLAGIFNVKDEADRIEKELNKTEELIKNLDKKLLNEDFLGRAPKAVVDKEKAKYEELIEKQQKLIENLSKMKELQE